jgi:hypothetical protein
MKRIIALSSGLALFACLAGGCSLLQTSPEAAAEAFGIGVPPDGEIYQCDKVANAGQVPHKTNEAHCCMTKVEEVEINQKVKFKGSVGDAINLNVKAKDYLSGELKLELDDSLDIDGTLQKANVAHHEHKANHCEKHTATSEGDCKPEYVMARYEITGNIDIKRSSALDFGGLFEIVSDVAGVVGLDLGGSGEAELEALYLCVSSPHEHTECSVPLEDGGQPPYDSGTACDPEAGTCTGGDAGTQDSGAQVDPCQGKTGTDCFVCCETHATSQAELDACIAKHQCGG